MQSSDSEPKQTLLETEPRRDFDSEKIEREWQLVTEAIKREISTDQELRAVLVEFSSAPISETLPEDAFAKISVVNKRVNALLSRFSESFGQFARLPSVEEKRVVPDLQNARLTPEERTLATTRYRFARDLKTLCLAAEMIDHPISSESNGQEVVLPSGVKVMVDSPYSEYGVELLNPMTWEKRRQLKDRVYEVTAGGKRYIMKEKKTQKHSHQKRKGYVEPLSSIQEFAIAKELNEKARTRYDNIQVSWEKPIGYAEFPDGFQFAIFEYDSVAKSRKPEDEYYEAPEVVAALRQKLVEHRQQYEAEYREIAALAEGKFLQDKELRTYESSVTDTALLTIAKVFGKGFKPVKLSFEDFVKIKAHRMMNEAHQLMVASHVALGYSNTDHDGFSCVVPEEGDVALEIVGYDFEYFKARENANSSGDYASRVGKYLYNEIVSDILSLRRYTMRDTLNRIQAAAYFALLYKEQQTLRKYVEGTEDDIDAFNWEV